MTVKLPFVSITTLRLPGLVRIPSSESLDSATTATTPPTTPTTEAPDKTCHSRRRRRRRVHFATSIEENKYYYYEQQHCIDDKEQYWYSAHDIQCFKKQRIGQVQRLQRRLEEEKGEPSKESGWTTKLAQLYFELTTTTTDSSSSLQQQKQPYYLTLPDDEWYGLERSVVPAVARDRKWRRHAVVQEVLYLEQQLHGRHYESSSSSTSSFYNNDDDEDELLRQASRDISIVSVRWAQYWGECLARDCRDA